jgi:hypothetical protein
MASRHTPVARLAMCFGSLFMSLFRGFMFSSFPRAILHRPDADIDDAMLASSARTREAPLARELALLIGTIPVAEKYSPGSHMFGRLDHIGHTRGAAPRGVDLR